MKAACSEPASACKEATWRDLEKFAEWGDLENFRRVCAAIGPGVCDPSSGWTPADFAVFHGQPVLLSWWVESLSSFYPQWGRSLMFRALIGRHGEKLSEILLAHGCCVSGRDDRGRTPLHVAAWLGDTGAVRPLVGAGLDLHARDDSMMTPLRWAIRGGHHLVVDQLLELGADPNLLDHLGISDAQFALVCGHEEVISRLRPHAEHRALQQSLPEGAQGDTSGRRL